MKLLPNALLGLFLVGCTWNIAQAEIIASNNVTSGVFFGTGNSNGNFTVAQDYGVEIGLRAKVRYPNPLDVDQSNLLGYDIDKGVYYFAEPAVLPRLDRASWNIDWSVNSDFNQGSGSATGNKLSAFTYDLTVTYDSLSSGGTDGSGSYNPLQDGNDNSYGNNGTNENQDVLPGKDENGDPTSTTASELNGLFTVAQNSTNITFSEIGLDNSFGGLYTIIFSVYDDSDLLQENPIATDQIQVYVGVLPPAAVPEPTSMAILGMGVLGFVGGGVARRRLKQKREASNS